MSKSSSVLAGKPLGGYRCMACDRPLEKLDEAPGPYVPQNIFPDGAPRLVLVLLRPAAALSANLWGSTVRKMLSAIVPPTFRGCPLHAANSAPLHLPRAQHVRSAKFVSLKSPSEDTASRICSYRRRHWQPCALPSQLPGWWPLRQPPCSYSPYKRISSAFACPAGAAGNHANFVAHTRPVGAKVAGYDPTKRGPQNW